MAFPTASATTRATSAVSKNSSVVFLTALGDKADPADSGRPGSNPCNPSNTADSSTSTIRPSASESSSISRVESLSRDSRRGRDVKDAAVDLIHFQPIPGSVKLSIITKKVLREAPFAVGNSKPLWKAFLTSRPYKELTADGFWFVIAHEILGIPLDATHSPRFSRMAHVYCHLFAKAPPIFKDIWGSYFFEAWALTLLILLQESFPKSKPMFDNPIFRMRLLDLCAEWTLGIRPSFPLTGHWVLKFDKRPPTELELLKRRTFGAGLSGTVSTSALSREGNGRRDDIRTKATASLLKSREGVPEHRLNYVPTKAVVEFGNSPLVNQHIRVLTGRERCSVTPVRLQVTGEATRTLRPFHEGSLRRSSDKIMRSNAWRAAQAVRASQERPATVDILTRIEERRMSLLHEHATSKQGTRREIARMQADAAEDRCSIQAEATNLFSKGDIHEFSNFLVSQKSKDRHRGNHAIGSGSKVLNSSAYSSCTGIANVATTSASEGARGRGGSDRLEAL